MLDPTIKCQVCKSVYKRFREVELKKSQELFDKMMEQIEKKKKQEEAEIEKRRSEKAQKVDGELCTVFIFLLLELKEGRVAKAQVEKVVNLLEKEKESKSDACVSDTIFRTLLVMFQACGNSHLMKARLFGEKTRYHLERKVGQHAIFKTFLSEINKILKEVKQDSFSKKEADFALVSAQSTTKHS